MVNSNIFQTNDFVREEYYYADLNKNDMGQVESKNSMYYMGVVQRGDQITIKPLI